MELTLDMRLCNIKSRLTRIEIIWGSDIYITWRKIAETLFGCKYIGNELNPIYIDGCEKLCAEVENQYHIYEHTIRIDEIKKNSNKTYEVMKLATSEFVSWINSKFEEFSNICRITIDKAKVKLYSIYIKFLDGHSTTVINNKDDLSGIFENDIETILKDYWLKRYFVTTIISATIGTA